MPAAPLPANEQQRLASLEASGWLEAGPDARLQALVRQAAAAFETPISAVTMLDASHQHFKASQGLDAKHTSRDEAFCGYAILEEDPLVVLDARRDPRFADNPLVRGRPDIRFYAGMPVYGADGSAYGALCVIDTQERDSVDPALLETLRNLARQVSAQIANAPKKGGP